MASPQKEDGYTPIANELLEVIYGTNFTSTELKTLLFIMRYTYGFSRLQHQLSLTFVSKGIGVSKRYVSSTIGKLIEDNILIVVKKHSDTQSRVIQINKDYNSWSNRSIVQQLNPTSTGEVKNNTTVEAEFNTTDEVEFHQDKQNIKQNIKQKNTPKLIKHKYGEFKHVLLTDEEKERLLSDLGQDMFNKCIVKLDEYIEMKGYKAKNHNLCIRKWVINAVNEDFNKTRQKGDENKTYGETYDTGNCYSLEYYEQFRNVK